MISIPIGLLALHFIGDFMLQSDWMALNKSKNWTALAAHVSAYTATFWPLFIVALGFNRENVVLFLVVTWLTHFLTDAWTSRITSWLWFMKPVNAFWNAGGKRYEMWVPIGGSRHWFFVVIGLDQLIHYVTLALTWKWLVV